MSKTIIKTTPETVKETIELLESRGLKNVSESSTSTPGLYVHVMSTHCPTKMFTVCDIVPTVDDKVLDLSIMKLSEQILKAYQIV